MRLTSILLLASTALATPSWIQASDSAPGKLVLADYMPHHSTRPFGNTLDDWRRDGLASTSQASVTRRVSNADLLDSDGRNQLASMFYPVTGMQSEEDNDYLEYQVLLAKSAGIDGFMVEWSSPGKTSNLKLRDTAERLGFFVGAQWQADQTQKWDATKALGANPTAEQLRDFGYSYALQLKQELYDRPTAPKLNGRPLVFFFAFGAPGYADMPGLRTLWGTTPAPLFARTIQSLPDTSATSVLQQAVGLVDGAYPWSSGGTALSEPNSTDPELAPLIAANTHDYYYSAETILAYRERWVGYTKTFETAGLPLRIGYVMPGVDNRPCGGWGTKLSYMARKNGDNLRNQWALYTRERDHLDVVYVATWNDWTESTVVQPTLEFGMRELLTTESGAAAFKGVPSNPAGLSLPLRLFQLRKGYAQLTRLGFPYVSPASRMDAIAQQISSRNYADASTALASEESTLVTLNAKVVSQSTTAPVTATVQNVVAATTEKTATSSTPVWLTLSTAVDTAISTRRCDTELTWEWLDADSSTYRIYTNSSGTAAEDTLAEIIGTSTNQWKTARIRIFDENCAFIRDSTAVFGGAVLKIVGNVTFRNMTLTAVRKDLKAAISRSPASRTLPVGSPINLEAEAGGTGPVSFHWRRNGADIASATSASYSVPSATTADSGTYELLVTNSLGTATTTPASITVLPLSGPFETWTATSGLPQNSRGETDDPDGDGIPNLLEYATGLSPITPNAPPGFTRLNSPLLDFVFPRNKWATDVTLAVEWTDNLASGTWSTAGLQPPALLSDDGSIQQFVVSPPATAKPSHVFFRLRGSRP